MAYLVAATVDAGWTRHEGEACERLAHASQLAHAIALDMSRWWRPTQQTYLGRVGKDLILEAVTEAKSPQAARSIAGLKKHEMAAKAEELLTDSNWLPKPLRGEPLVRAA